tara:strand:+ start:2911 stop:3438 length:528 start_codon:yes stop_codon:yes gene_type:complete
MKKLLVVGVGNVLNSDDAFGPRLIHQFKTDYNRKEGLTIMETGIGGINIIQEMLLGYNGLIIVDSYQGGKKPGTVRILKPKVENLDLSIDQKRDYFADTHYANPFRVLQFLKNINILPKFLFIIACEPESLKPHTIKLSHTVSNAIDDATVLLNEIINKFFNMRNIEDYANSDCR